jgi:hypothetical protein
LQYGILAITIPASAPTTMDASANESHKIKYSEDVKHDKIKILEVRVRVINEGILGST